VAYWEWGGGGDWDAIKIQPAIRKNLRKGMTLSYCGKAWGRRGGKVSPTQHPQVLQGALVPKASEKRRRVALMRKKREKRNFLKARQAGKEDA